ncbi:hypothetical protein PGTUg99_035757 [Puccinia graminis f. sp. tritici]|uniref:Uncharacterized protein n=1 Tax=Puccinia graminis f. sp. tritici TaxID=56615 RepID=A0A5B0S174_PUCGR|nr:hypothetical protein PGTUg99_035757 [Puccinia graminis f. sp. tritici]
MTMTMTTQMGGREMRELRDGPRGSGMHRCDNSQQVTTHIESSGREGFRAIYGHASTEWRWIWQLILRDVICILFRHVFRFLKPLQQIQINLLRTRCSQIPMQKSLAIDMEQDILSIIDHQTPSGLRSAAYHYIPSQSTVLRIPCSSRTNYQDSAKRQCGT